MEEELIHSDGLPVKWIGADGSTHEVSVDYAAEICKWIFDTYGDVDAVDIVIRKGA